eukprot:GEZU01039131.1.p1 GENE.GEZU01039131.1~~GEZU01039131.1.p1  ORF type:complete len:588 (+),score=189.24 GEZU01039131.1:30-1766(+)
MKAASAIIALVTIVALAFASSAFVLAQVPSIAVNIWPRPNVVETGTETISVDATQFKFTSNMPNNDVLNQAFDRYSRFIFYYQGPYQESRTKVPKASASVTSLKVTVHNQDDASNELVLGVDESYNLTISSDSSYVDLQCQTIWGALRGLETFSQLVAPVYSGSLYQIVNTPINIVDKPRFPWRGFMIDTARHYYNVDTILSIIDAMSYNKFNTLHWHMVDAQSFAVQIKSYPLLSQKGSWAPTAVYTSADIAQVIEYAYYRGIRVVPEFDVPGHAASWGNGYPDIVAKCPSYAANVNNIPLNVALPFTYAVIEGVVSEMTSLFSDQYFHFGGDELVYGCWLEDPSITSFMQKMGIKDQYELEVYFENQLQAIYTKYNRTLVGWQELVLVNPDLELPAGSIVEAWSGTSALYEIASKGYHTLLAAGFYLDQQRPGSQTWYEWEDTWKNFYLNEPFTAPSPSQPWTPELQKLVLGGEACMWSEQVDDSNFDSRVWPRACAVAERLWSEAQFNDYNEALPRLIAHRCSMVRRGVGAGPLAPDYCDAVYSVNNWRSPLMRNNNNNNHRTIDNIVLKTNHKA